MGPRIACFGEFTSGKTEALCWALVFRGQIARRLPEATLSWFSCFQGPAQTSRLGPIHPIQSAIEIYPEGPDAMVLGGGIVLRTRLASKRAPSAATCLCPPGTEPWLLPSLLAFEWDVPLLWDALRVSPALSNRDGQLLKLATQLARHRCVRDPVALQHLTTAGGEPLIDLAPDLRVLLADVAPESLLRRAWLRLLGQPKGPGLPTLLCQPDEETCADDDVVDALERLRRGQFPRLILMSDTANAPATARLRQLAAKLGNGVVLIERRLSLFERLALIWGADAWLGSGAAGFWAALAFRKPHLILGQRQPAQSYAALLKRPDLVLADVAALAARADLLSPAQIPILTESHAQLSQMAHRHLDRLAELISAAAQRQRTPRAIAWDDQGPELPRCQPLLAAIAPLAAKKWLDAAANRQKRITVLKGQLHKANKRADALQQSLDRHFTAWRYRAVDRLSRCLRKLPLALTFSFWLTRVLYWLWRRWHRQDASPAALARYLERVFFIDPALGFLFKPDTEGALRSYLFEEMKEICLGAKNVNLNTWFQKYRPEPSLLERFRMHPWPDDAPLFSVLIRLNPSSGTRLAETLRSLATQTYPKWEARIVIPQVSLAPDALEVLSHEAPRLPNCFAHESEDAALHAARGDYFCFLEHGDVLEPQALHRFAQVVLSNGPGLLYSDAVSTGDDLDDVRTLHARPAFSYDYFLAHGYIDHLLAVRTELLRQAGGLDCGLELDRATDWVLRVLEREPNVSHVPDVLYRRREVFLGVAGERDVAAGRRRAVANHLDRLDAGAELADTDHAGCIDVRWPAPAFAKTAIIIATKDQCALLRTCIDSLRATLAPDRYQLCVVDHESREPATREYLTELGKKHQVVPYQGPFNFSRLMNHGVARLNRPCDHYLFLNNDVEALTPGWLEHMLGIACRPEVGAVGALLLYPDKTVQHGGAVVGMHLAADHVFKRLPAYASSGRRQAGRDMSLLAPRDQSIVTAACLLVRAEVFHAVGGYDPALAVGFGDSDLCLRMRARGFKIILDPQAVLLHHESASRGQDPHPLDTQRFRARYLDLIMSGDPCYSPLLSRRFSHELNPYARAKEVVEARTVSMILPVAAATAVMPRIFKRAG